MSIPLIGLSPFPRTRSAWFRTIMMGVNALYRASSVSSFGTRKSISAHQVVLMPFVGLPTFLLIIISVLGVTLPLCQCPSSGFLLFYPATMSMSESIFRRVNALARASSISTKTTMNWTFSRKQSVNALARASSISTYNGTKKDGSSFECQCP